MTTVARPRTGRRRAWVAVAVVVAAVGWLLAKGLGSATVYFFTADQAAAKAFQLGTQRFRIEGTVMAGTVAEQTGAVRFCIANAGVRVAVRNTGYPPQLFQPDIPVVLEGHFAAGGATPVADAPDAGAACPGGTTAPVFDSDLIMVKHSSVYRAQHPNRVSNFVGKR